MAFTTVYNGFVISEGKLDKSTVVGEVKCDLSFVFGAQLKSLRDVKDKLLIQAREMGANAIENFTYGQKARWLALDDVAFWGKGIAVILPLDEYNKYVNP